MPLHTDCSQCRTSYVLADHLEGKKVRCKTCGETFRVVAAGSFADDEDLPILEPLKAEDRIQKRPASVVPFGGQRHVEPEETFSQRRGNPPPPPPPSRVLILVLFLAVLGAAVVSLVVVLAVVGTKAFFPNDPPAPAGPVVAADPRREEIPVRPGQPIPPALVGQPIDPIPPAMFGQPELAPPDHPPAVGVLPGNGSQKLRYRWEGGPHVYAVKIEADLDDYLESHEGNCVVRVRRNERPVGPANASENRKGFGTGFVVSPDGYLVTCAHVVAEARKVEVNLAGRKYPATVLALDADRDLAVLKIAAKGLPVLALGNSETAEVGQEVRAIGFPLSDVLGENLKATRGTLSGINSKQGKKVLQIDASLNPGNSGGPLVAETGQVLGVASATLLGDAISNVGLVVPIDEVKRLLTAKNVPFVTEGWNAKLDGPTLVKRVSAAVALIDVTLDPDKEPDSFHLTCQGRLMQRKKAKPGVILIPGIPSFPGFGLAGVEIDVDPTGRILQVNGRNQLPFLLGDLGLALIEPLPPDNRIAWETTGSCAIEESENQFPGIPFGPMGRPPGLPDRFGIPRPFGPFGPGGPFGGGVPPFGGQAANRLAKERSVYSRAAAPANAAKIQKRYELKADAGAGGSPSLELVGNGEIIFDLKLGAPRETSFKGTLTLASGGVPRRVPLTMSYQQVEGAERERVLNPPPPPKVAPKTFTDADLAKALQDLQTTDRNRLQSALDQLAQAPPSARRTEVAKALAPILGEKDLFVRIACVRALGVWGNADSVPALLKLLEDDEVFVRFETMTSLGKLKDERAAEPIARRLKEPQNRHRASKALQALGTKAEKAVVPYLQNGEWTVRLEAATILGAIGTKESKAALEASAKDDNGLVANEAKRAIEAIGKRP